ncbi:MAG: GAF domain-containing protein [Anaerolineae bacterium]|nr:GAF domain-containing protein [Anaerolineae bacterium]
MGAQRISAELHIAPWRLRHLALLCLAVVTLCTCAPHRSEPTVTPTSTPSSAIALPSRPINLSFERLNLEAGLSQSGVYDIVQDTRGFLWIATEDGLNRYDGYAFEVFRPIPGDPNSIADGFVQALLVDSDGQLWIGTNAGLDRYDAQTNTFIHIGADGALHNADVLALFEDRSGSLWVGMHGGGYARLDRATGLVERVLLPENGGTLDVQAIAQDVHGTIWIGAEQGLYRDGSPERALPGNIHALYVDQEGHLWIGSAENVTVATPSSTSLAIIDQFEHDPDNPNTLTAGEIRVIKSDQSGTIWIGTTTGLNRFDPDTGHFTRYEYDPDDDTSIGTPYVRSLFEDREGILWVGTYGGGLAKASPFAQQFRLLLDGPGVTGMVENPPGTLWAGTLDDGLFRIDLNTGETTQYTHDPDDPASLVSDHVWDVYLDSQKAVWIGTVEGLSRFDPANGVFTRFVHDPTDANSLGHNHVWAILEDSDGIFWFGTEAGLDRFDPDSRQFTHFMPDASDPTSLSSHTVIELYEDSAENLWVGTFNSGLDKLDRATGRFTHYAPENDNPDALSHQAVIYIEEAEDGSLWIGTYGGGLNHFDVATETFTHFSSADGLPNDVVYAMLEDGTGGYWISTNRGLSHFDPATNSFENYDAGDGLQSNEFNLHAALQANNGDLLFGGIDGLTAFDPRQVTGNPTPPPVVLTHVTQGGDVAALTAPAQLTLTWPQNFFEFEFAALSYVQPDANQYAYMLEGFDDQWNENGTRRFGRYTNLPGGTYTLYIKGSNGDGVWSENDAALTVTVVPPLWERTWAQVLFLLTIAATAVTVYGLRVRTIEQRSRQLETEVAERTSDLAGLNAIAAVVSQSLDLQETLDSALAKTVEVMRCDGGGIYLLHNKGSVQDPSRLSLKAHHGLAMPLVTEIDDLLVGEGFSGRAVQSGQPLVVTDLTQDQRLTRHYVVESGFQALAVAPLLARNTPIGALFVMTRQQREFDERDRSLLSAIGGQVGVAVEQATLFSAEQRRAEQFRVITEVGQHITSILDIDDLLVQIVRLVQQSFGFYHVGIGLIDGDEFVYKVGAGPLWDDPDFEFSPARFKLGAEGIGSYVADSGQPLLIPDVLRESRYVAMQGSSTRSELTVPIKAKGAVLGVLDAQSDRLNAFDKSDVTVLQTLALQAGIAIENARLYEQAQAGAILEERQRIARELHDSVTQALYGVTLYSQAASGQLAQGHPDRAADHLEELQDTAQEALAEMRLLIHELRPPLLAEEGLAAALQARLQSVEGRAGLQTTFKVVASADFPVEQRLPKPIEQGLYRIGQEALNNTLKHARAAHIDVLLRLDPRRVVLEIRDDGIGFDPALAAEGGGAGLIGMAQRAVEMGGQFTIDSSVQQGTHICVEVPL